MACYGQPPPPNEEDSFFAPKKAAQPPPPADFFSQGGTSNTDAKLSPAVAEWKPSFGGGSQTSSAGAGAAQSVAQVTAWKPNAQEDTSPGVDNQQIVTDMLSQLSSVLSDGAGTAAVIENMEGGNSVEVSLFTILMSPKLSVREPIYEALPTLMPSFSSKTDADNHSDVAVWLCVKLAERTMVCSKAEKRQAAVESMGRLVRHLSQDQAKHCVSGLLALVRAALAASGKEATTGKLGSMALLEVQINNST